MKLVSIVLAMLALFCISTTVVYGIQTFFTIFVVMVWFGVLAMLTLGIISVLVLDYSREREREEEKKRKGK